MGVRHCYTTGAVAWDSQSECDPGGMGRSWQLYSIVGRALPLRLRRRQSSQGVPDGQEVARRGRHAGLLTSASIHFGGPGGKMTDSDILSALKCALLSLE